VFVCVCVNNIILFVKYLVYKSEMITQIIKILMKIFKTVSCSCVCSRINLRVMLNTAVT